MEFCKELSLGCAQLNIYLHIEQTVSHGGISGKQLTLFARDVHSLFVLEGLKIYLRYNNFSITNIKNL